MSRTARRALVCLTVAAFALAGVSAIALDASPPRRTYASLQKTPAGGPSERTLTVLVPPLQWRTEADGAVHPELDGYGWLTLAGAPELPARRERVAIEPGGGLAITGIDVEWSEGLIPGTLVLHPPLDSEAWKATGEYWPAEPARVARQDGGFRSLRFAEVEITPVQVDIAAGRFRIAERLVIHLVRAGGAGASRGWAPDLLLDSLGEDLALGASEVGRGPMGESAGASEKAPVGPLAAPTYPAWQIEVDQDGLHRLTYAWVQANLPGLELRDPRQFRMTVQGVEIPILVEGESDGTFNTSDAIVFYGQQAVGDLFGPTVNPDDPSDPGWHEGDFTDVNIYRVDLATGPARIVAQTGTRSPQPEHNYPVPASFRTTVHFEEDDRIYSLIPENGTDHFVFDPTLNAYCRTTSTCPDADKLDNSLCNGCATGSTCCAGFSVQAASTPGYYGGPVSVRGLLIPWNTATDIHRSEVWLDGVLRDTDDWDGYYNHLHEFTFAGPLNSTTTVKTRLPLGRFDSRGARVPTDSAAFDWVEFDYDRNYTVVADRLTFTSPNANHEIRLTGVTTLPRLWEITETTQPPGRMAIDSPRRVDGVTLFGNEARFEYDINGGPATRRFVAATTASHLVPRGGRRDLPPSDVDPAIGDSLKGAGLGAHWLVIGHRSLVNSGPQFSALVARRQGQGLQTAIVDIRDVYDEFTDGIEDPQAIRDFIAWALANWVPAPVYVVLVGDATLDYKNLYGYNPPRQFVPTYMIDAAGDQSWGAMIGDVWFGAITDGDGVPDVLIGRIPAHTPSEVEIVSGKIVSYEQSAAVFADWQGKAMLVSEYDGSMDFFTPHNYIYDEHFTSGSPTAEKVYEGNPDPPPCNDAAEAERMLIASNVNGGAAVLSVVSHGNWLVWGGGCTFFEVKSPPPSGEPCPAYDLDDPRCDDLDLLTNGSKLQFHVHANCLTGAFEADSPVSATIDSQYSFFEDWLVTAGKGAVAGIAPSHLSRFYRVDAVLNPVYEAIYGRAKERVTGLIDLQLRLNLHSLMDDTTARSYSFQGDPATRLVVPAPPPTNITSVTTAGSGELQVSWSSVPGVSRYKLYRADYPGGDSNGDYTEVYDGPATSVTDGGEQHPMENCKEYYYYAVSVDAHGFESRRSNYNDTCYGARTDCKAGTPENPDPPAQVIGVTAADTEEGGRLRVSWAISNQAADVERYRVFWSETSGGPWLDPQSNVTTAPNKSLTIGGLENKRTYYIVVRAEHCTLNGPFSAQATGVPHLVRGISPPDAITDLRVTKIPVQDLKLEWTVPALTVWGTPTTVTSVEVYGSQTTGPFPLDTAHLRTVKTAPPLDEWVHTGAGAPSGGNWFYTVAALNGVELRSAGGAELPDGVADLTVSYDRIGNAITLEWSAVTRDLDGNSIDIAGYNVYGQASTLPRGGCYETNLLAGDLASAPHVQTAPPDLYYTWQVLAKDRYSCESVW